MTKFETSAVRPAPTPPGPQVGRLGGRVDCAARPSLLSSFEKGRQDKEPGASSMGMGNRGIAPRGHHWVAAMEKSQGPNTRTIRPEDENSFRVPPARKFSGDSRNIFRGVDTRAPAFAMTTAQWNRASSGAIAAHMRDTGLTLKEVAQKIGCSDRTAENYVQGRTSPAGLHFLRCIAVIPEFEAEVRRVTSMMMDFDPRAHHAALELVRAAQKFVDARDRTATSDSSDNSAGGEDDLAVGDLFEGR